MRWTKGFTDGRLNCGILYKLISWGYTSTLRGRKVYGRDTNILFIQNDFSSWWCRMDEYHGIHFPFLFFFFLFSLSLLVTIVNVLSAFHSLSLLIPSIHNNPHSQSTLGIVCLSFYFHASVTCFSMLLYMLFSSHFYLYLFSLEGHWNSKPEDQIKKNMKKIHL